VLPGSTVVVGAATGPVGSLVGQLAKRAGATAIGIAGGSHKCELAVSQLGFDKAVDHRDPDFPRLLAAACADGIDLYYENVGGAVWDAVLPLLNRHARIPISGLVAQYNALDESSPRTSSARLLREILSKRLRVEGFLSFELAEWFDDFTAEVRPTVLSGEIKYIEHHATGIDGVVEAFRGMLLGHNIGKTVVDIDAD
jgi:NADPH-dependent curcumin reductase CurA